MKKTLIPFSLIALGILTGCNNETDLKKEVANDTVPDTVVVERPDINITDDNDTETNTSGYYAPTLNDSFYIVLNGSNTINADENATMLDIDLFDTSQEKIDEIHQKGKKVICYFSAGSFEDWRPDADKFTDEMKGEKMEGWDELWLDIRIPALTDIMKARIDLAKEKNCDAVDPDNIDGYSNNTGFDFTMEDEIAYLTTLAEYAHKQGMAIGFKNGLRMIPTLKTIFDFDINEQCHQYEGDCDWLKGFVEEGKPVFNIEYEDKYIDDENEFKKLCDSAVADGFFTFIAPYELDGSFYKPCPVPGER